MSHLKYFNNPGYGEKNPITARQCVLEIASRSQAKLKLLSNELVVSGGLIFTKSSSTTLWKRYLGCGNPLLRSGFQSISRCLLGDSHAYRPERWIVDEATQVRQEDVDRARAGFNPFLTGPMSCVGRSLAMIELQAAVGRTLWRYDMRRVPGSTYGGGSAELAWGQRDPDHYRLIDAYIAVHHGPMLQFRKKRV